MPLFPADLGHPYPTVHGVVHWRQVVKWLFENRQEGCTPAAAEGAAGQGHDEIVKYLRRHKRGRSVDYNDLGKAIVQA